MASLSEKLQGVYGGQGADKEAGKSWIPKRLHNKGDLAGELRGVATEADGVSGANAERIIAENMILNEIRNDIFTGVRAFLLAEYGEEELEWRMGNFGESWEKYYEKYGDDLILALGELTDDLSEWPFVNYAGFIERDTVKEQVKSIRERARRLKNS